MLSFLLAVGLVQAVPPAPLPPASLRALEAALEDERQAEATYRAILRRHGELRPFSNLVTAEVRHQQALSGLFEAHGLPVPPDRRAAAPPEAPAMLPEALRRAIKAEEDNVALYGRLLAAVQEPNLRRVFERLRWASQHRHLPALRRQVRD